MWNTNLASPQFDIIKVRVKKKKKLSRLTGPKVWVI